MQAFIVRHKPTGKFLSAGYGTARKSEVLRKTKGHVWIDRDAAERSIGCAVDPRLKELYPKELHGGKKRDFEIKEFTLDLNAIAEGA